MIAAGAGAFLWVAVGLLACYGASQLGVGNVAEPGAGFIFFWSGLLLVILSLIVFTDSARIAAETAPKNVEMKWTKIALVLLSLLLYAFCLERLGFVLTTFILVGFFLGCIEDINWLRSLGVACSTALATYAMFELWLKIRLPKGLFGF